MASPWLYLLFILSGIGLLGPLLWRGNMRWGYRKALTAPRVSDELRARLGDDLAAWLERTRTLRSEITLLEEHARTMLAQERASRRPDGRRPRHREMDDINFRDAIQRMQRAGHEWQGKIGALDRASLASFEIDPTLLDDALDIPWTLVVELDLVPERSADIELALERIVEIGQMLAIIDGTLSAPPAEPYR